MRKILIVSGSLLTMTFLVIFHVKYNASLLRDALRAKQAEKHRLLSDLELLQVELAHLSAPGRLDRLNKRLLKLTPTTGHQMRRFREVLTSSATNSHKKP